MHIVTYGITAAVRHLPVKTEMLSVRTQFVQFIFIFIHRNGSKETQ